MVTYQLEWRTPQRSGWEPYGPPADSVSACTNAAAHSTRVGGEEFRLVGLSTELQPDGTITRRELSPDELAAAIRGEQVAPKTVKAVVVATDDNGNEAMYVDGQRVTQLGGETTIYACDIGYYGGDDPITFRHVNVVAVDRFPDRFDELQISD